MTHKGGKRAKKAFKSLKLSASMKEKIEDLPHSQLAVLLTFIRALMAASAGKAHRRTGAKKKSTRHLKPGTHNVRIRGKMRRVKVLASGRWQFLKG